MKKTYKNILNSCLSGILLFHGLAISAQEWRTIDGVGNNLNSELFGASHTELLRLVDPAYEDSISEVQSLGLPNARELSNRIVHQELPIYNSFGLSDAFWCYGQFIDHDLVINRGDRGELIIVPVPKGDIYFDPTNSGKVTLRVDRGRIMPETGDSKINPREHINETTAFLDGSVIYGTESQRLNWMRTGRAGKMKVSANNLLPYNTYSGEYSDDIDFVAPFMELPPEHRPERYFVNGDIRANEHPGLAVFHVLFVREHNRICDQMLTENPNLTDDELFQIARKWIGALLQHITYNEWLPALGVRLTEYTGYDDSIDPSISNEFSAVAFRFGHSLVNETLLRININGNASQYGGIQIRDTFFRTESILNEGGIDPILRGLTYQLAQDLDEQIVGTLRNFLFGPPGSGGLDLAVLNIERSRERGIPSLNSIRNAIGINPYSDFSFLGDASLEKKFADQYSDVNKVEPWIGMLAEPDISGSILGSTMHEIISEQFLRIRAGDRFWYENDSFFSQADLEQIKQTKLSDIVKRNTSILSISEDMFFVDSNNVLGVAGLDEMQSMDVALYPNPAIEYVTISINSRKQWSGNLAISNINGQVVFERTLNVTSGVNSFTFDINSKLSSGIYQVVIENHTGGVFRLVKK
ncbi:MAG: peroxidase family protein [Marinoscillum sp.]